LGSGGGSPITRVKVRKDSEGKEGGTTNMHISARGKLAKKTAGVCGEKVEIAMTTEFKDGERKFETV